jgi:hypothetical protein
MGPFGAVLGAIALENLNDLLLGHACKGTKLSDVEEGGAADESAVLISLFDPKSKNTTKMFLRPPLTLCRHLAVQDFIIDAVPNHALLDVFPELGLFGIHNRRGNSSECCLEQLLEDPLERLPIGRRPHVHRTRDGMGNR